MKTINKILVGSIAGLIVGGTIGHLAFPNVETVTETVEVPVIETVTETVTETVYVDNENLDLVLENIYENDGDIEYIVDGLDDDELDKIVDRIAFENEFSKFAEDEVKSGLFDELHKEKFNGVKFLKEDMSRLNVDKVEMKSANYKYGDAVFRVSGDFTHDDVRYTFSANVAFKDFEFNELSVIDIN